MTFDNQSIVVPNRKVWGDTIKNITERDTRRVDMVFGIGYEDDIDKAKQTLEEILDVCDRVLDERGRIEWVGLENGQEEISTSEPQAGFWRKLTAGFLGIFPIEGQL